MMSEKKFTIESERINATCGVRILKDDEVIFEINNWNSLGEMHKRECEDIVVLLNELSEEKEYFERKKEYFLSKWSIAHVDNIQLRQEIKELKKENEQLKIANARWLDKSLQDRQIRYNNTNHKELTKKYLQLKEENEQLKKAEKINMEYAEQILEENHKFRIVKNDLRIKNEQLQKENEQLRQKLKHCEHERFLDELGSSNKWFWSGRILHE